MEQTDSTQQLMQAALERGDASAVRSLLQAHSGLRRRINEPSFAFNAPAITAFANDADTVEVLLEFGANPNAKSEWWAGGFHPLYVATGRAAELLIAAGAAIDACAAAHLDRVELLAKIVRDDPARVHERGGDGQTPLHFARSRAAVDVLLAAGADLDARDVDHRSTAAEWMLERRLGAGRYELARYLVDRGAAADIFLAAALGLADRIEAMLRANPGVLELRTGQDEYGEKPPSSYHIYFWTIGDSMSPIDVAAQFEQAEALAAMLRVASPLQQLLFACRLGDAERARAIVREHPNLVSSMRPADHRAVADAAWNGNARAVAMMLELGFNPRTTGHDSGTPLHLAAWEGSAEVVSLLLQHPDARELVAIRDAHHDATPLGWCCHGSLNGNRRHDHAAVARLLLDAGAVNEGEDLHASPSVMAVLSKAR